QRMSWLDPRNTPGKSRSNIEQLYARALWRNVGLLVGRDHLFLGQGADAGLMSSFNARAIDQVRIGSDRPFVLPWLLRYVGPSHATLALGDLGPKQFFPHTRFLAYKFSTRPHQL